MKFASPYWLFLLAVIPVLLAVYLFADRRKESILKKIVSDRLRSLLVSSPSGRGVWRSRLLILTGIALIVIALARPQIGKAPDVRERKGIDIMFMIDSSQSMGALDVSPNRFEASKNAIREILDHLKGDKVGLALFTNASLKVTPFTTDYGSLEHFLKLADMKVFLNNATNIEYSVQETMKGLESTIKKARVIVVLSDGEDEPGIKYSIPDDLIASDIRVYAFGIGTEEGGKIPVYSETGAVAAFMRDQNGAEIMTKLEEEPLKELSSAYNGRYYRYSRGAVKKFVSDLDGMKRELIEEKEDMVFQDYFQIFLMAGVVVLIIGKLIAGD